MEENKEKSVEVQGIFFFHFRFLTYIAESYDASECERNAKGSRIDEMGVMSMSVLSGGNVSFRVGVFSLLFVLFSPTRKLKCTQWTNLSPELRESSLQRVV